MFNVERVRDEWGDLDWISEEKYNLMKEKYNMPKKKKKIKKKKKKAKAKKKKKRQLRCGIRIRCLLWGW